jgi:hypothetical protein
VRTQERLGDGRDVVKPRVDYSGLRLHKKCSSELKPDESEGKRVNQGVSLVVDGEAELTEAGAQRRSWNRRRASVSGGGAAWLRA